MVIHGLLDSLHGFDVALEDSICIELFRNNEEIYGKECLYITCLLITGPTSVRLSVWSFYLSW